jgi:sulfite exporter TauE/SafE
MEGLLLGLSTGTSCLVLCGPVVLPYILGEGTSVKKSLIDILLFLGSRFIAYMILGLIAALIGQTFLNSEIYQHIITGSAYMILSVMLVVYSFIKIRHICAVKPFSEALIHRADKRTIAIPIVGGLVTGLSLCPALLLAFSGAASRDSLLGSLDYFIFFYLGTSVYFLPLMLLGLTHGRNVIHIVGKITAGLAGLIFFIKGLMLVLS